MLGHHQRPEVPPTEYTEYEYFEIFGNYMWVFKDLYKISLFSSRYLFI